MKLNRKGFTLVELLVTILIIGLVVGFSVYGIISLINNSEEKTTKLSENSIKEAARIYSTEANSDSWKKTNIDYDAFCVTVGELMNKGLLNKDSTIPEGIDKKTYIMVKRNKITLAVESEEIITIGTDNYNICTGETNIDGEDYTRPKVSGQEIYTNKLIVNFDDGSAHYQGNESIVSYKCLYGNSSSNINREGKITGNSCEIDNLKNTDSNGIKIPYYVFIYMNTNNGTSVLAKDESEYYTLADFKDTMISQNANKITIKYDDTRVLDASYYFKSSAPGTLNIDAEKCTLNRDIFECTNSSNNIEKDVWYKVSNKEVHITYPEENNTIDITTRIYDGSNNFKENSSDLQINKYVVKFYKNNASSIDGSTNSYIEKYCIAGRDDTCSITSPSIEVPTGYLAVGWNTSSTATTSSWNVNIKKDVNKSVNYYAIIKKNLYTITFDYENNIYNQDPSTWIFHDEKSKVNNNYSYNNTTGVQVYSTGERFTGIRIPINSDKKQGTNYELSLYAYRTVDFDGDLRVYATTFNSAGNPITYHHDSANMSINNNLNKNLWKLYSTQFNVGSYVSWTHIYIDFDTINQGPVYISNIRFDEISKATKIYGTSYGSMPTPTRTGYTFDGWYTGANGTGTKITSSTIVSTEKDHTLYANWNVTPYTITYNLNGGTVSGNPTSYTIESSAITLKNPTRTGYTFTGWTGSNGSTASTSVTIAKGSTGNKSYTANWRANSYTYNIVYKSSTGTQLGTTTITREYGTTNTVSPKSFAGYTSPSSQSIKWDNVSAKIITFTYTPISYSITYTLNNGSVSGNPSSYTIESSAITLKNPTRTGYTFTGWTGSNGSTASTSVTIAKGSTGNKSYTANWRANTYTITYNANGGSGAPSTRTANVGEKITLSDTIPKRGTESCNSQDNYIFLGWSTNSGATSPSYYYGSEFTHSENSNITLYAIWEKNGTRFTKSSDNKITVYNITHCKGNACTYDRINGIKGSGTVTKSSLYTNSSLFSPPNFYFGTKTLYCYCSPDTTSSSKGFSWCDAWMINYTNDYNGEAGPNYIAAWPTTVSGWYYSRRYNCFVEAKALAGSYSSSKLPTSTTVAPALGECPIVPSCTITATTVTSNIKKYKLTITASDYSGKFSSAPYSWDNSTWTTENTKNVALLSTGTFTYTAYVKDAAGHVGSCSITLTK